ncbi:MAG: excinuclease ABC subunit UvrC [Leptospiraceae bacterium]|nr:excinuclease ABC subunit UvrC [Leptospiraceae bacterium]
MVEKEQLDLIKEKINNLSTLPGCYLWKDINKNVIYVGKALKLSERIRSYLNKNITDPKTSALQSEIFDLDWIITNNEEEALILEANLIKKYNPKYNVRLKDDKKYPFICVSTDEPFPMVYLTRKVKSDGKKYFGPYTDVKTTRDLLNFIHKIFPIRKTPLKLPLKKPGRPCLNFQIKRCMGPCQGNVSEEEYNQMINQVVKFLEGKKDELIFELQKKMQEYSEKLLFERALLFRNAIEMIQQHQKKQGIINQSLNDEDILALARKENSAQIVIFEIRSGRLEGKKSFALDGTEFSEEEEIFLSFIKLYYFNSEFIPDFIKYPYPINKDAQLVENTLKTMKEKKVLLKNAKAGYSRSIWKLAVKNAEMNLTERILATKLRDNQTALKDLKTKLNLDKTPSIIECYDISHFQGKEPVASGVMFVDGKPYKQGYRHYKMKSYVGINDPGMMHEVIARRLQRLLNENEDLPDLIVIDGGYTQLSRATEAAVALELENIFMVGLAKKREEIYFPGEKYPIKFDINSPAIRLLRQIRDEAHRFGITYHRKRRNKATLKTLLDDIPDVGEVRRKSIIKYFQNKKKVSDARYEELLEITGIGPSLAKKIMEYIKKD